MAIGICAIAWYLPGDYVLIMHFSNIFLPMPNIVFSIVVFFMIIWVHQIFVDEIIILLRLIMF
jgi:hypothetical protein